MEKYCTARPATYYSIIGRMRNACWTPNAANTESECVILYAFPLQQGTHERASILRYTYIACLFIHLISREE